MLMPMLQIVENKVCYHTLCLLHLKKCILEEIPADGGHLGL